MSSTVRALAGCQIFDKFVVPDGWACVPLGERIELAYGSGLREEDREPGEVDVFGSNGIVGRHTRALVPGPGLLVGRKGTVGAVHYTDRSFWPIDTVYYVVPRRGDSMRFLHHLLDYMPLKALNAATGVPGLSRRDVYSLLGAFPPPREQASVARVLDSVDTTIDGIREVSQRVDTLQNVVLEESFDRLAAKHCRLDAFLTDIRYGTSVASSDNARGNPVLRIPNVVGDRLALDDVAFVELPAPDVDRLSLEDGDLLLVRTNGNRNYVGRSVVFRRLDNRIWLYASYLIRIRLNGDLLPDFVNTYLRLEPGRRQLLQRVTTSAGNHNINTNSIRLIRLPVPPRAEQERLVGLATAFRNRRDAITDMIDALYDLKKSLMHDFLTGRVRVGDRRTRLR
ncbi:MAG: hypothetical protein F4205_11205 [Gemmatimonadetes bacterium]|nr:hypothetical protein [Gemmatimonadota bacterium]